MKNKLTLKVTSSFHISVGEEGAVIILYDNGVVKSKMFVRSSSDQDTVKLRQLFTENPNSPIHIYIDTLDQSYIQKNIPSSGGISVYNLAKKRLERDTPKNHLKACIQVGRMSSGRKDYLFTFISTPLEPPLSTWLDFLIPFQNIINGIHFLPIEMYSIIKQINLEQGSSNNMAAKKTPFFDRLKGYLTFLAVGTSSSNSARWELLITHNKTGGFRQVAFQNDKIVFSRLLNDINHPDADVLAGNIEQEIASSVEYLTRLSLRDEAVIDMYIVLAEDVLSHIRIDKLKASRVHTSTPYQLGQLLKVADAVGEKDKFADPAVLAYLSKINRQIVTVHTPITERVYKYTSKVHYVRVFLDGFVPIALGLVMMIFIGLTSMKNSILTTINQTQVINDQIRINTVNLESMEAKIGQNIKIDHLIEIHNLYKFLTAHKINVPEEVFLKLGRVIPDFTRAKEVKWTYNDPSYYNYKNTDKITLLSDKIPATWAYNYVINYTFLFLESGKTFTELEQKYQELSNTLRALYSDYKIDISGLPQGFALDTVTQKTTIYFQAKKEFDPIKQIVTKPATMLPQAQAQPPQPEVPSLQRQSIVPPTPLLERSQ